MVKFQQLTGCRPGELVKITPQMVDRSRDVWCIELIEHKTAYRNKERFIYVGPQAQKVLLPYLSRASDKPCFSPIESEAQRLAAKHEARINSAKLRQSAGHESREKAEESTWRSLLNRNLR